MLTAICQNCPYRISQVYVLSQKVFTCPKCDYPISDQLLKDIYRNSQPWTLKKEDNSDASK